MVFPGVGGNVPNPNTYTVLVQAGTLRAGDANGFPFVLADAQRTAIRPAGTIDAAGIGFTVNDLRGGGQITDSGVAATLTVNGGIFGGIITGPLSVSVTGSLILAGNNSYTGTTTIGGGSRLTLGNAGATSADPRWVFCHRPTVVVGGELTIDMLDLQFNSGTKFYAAPGQMKANNGVLIIDDFGRQRIRPEELLNRWVVPLDRRIDFLSLAGGKKIEIPFEVIVVFATNMDPSEMMDPAFLRRIQTKIKVEMASEQQFSEIFRRICDETGLVYDRGLIDELMAVLQNRLKEPLRPCYPRDLVNQIIWAARYEGWKPKLDRDSLVRAVERYFLSGRGAQGGAV